MAFIGGCGRVSPTAEFTPDGTCIVTATINVVQVWNSVTGRPLQAALAHNGLVTSAKSSFDSKSLVIVSRDDPPSVTDDGIGIRESDDSTIRIWSTLTRRSLTSFWKDKDGVRSAEFSPDGRSVLTAGGTVKVRDASSGQVITALTHRSMVNTAHFSPDGKLILTASADKTVRAWSSQTGKATMPPINHSGQVQSADFSPNSKWIITQCNAMDGSRPMSQIWSSHGGEPVTDPYENEAAVSFSPKGDRFLTRSGKTAKIWDFQPTSTTIPTWLPRLAEAVAGQRLDENGFFKSLREDQLRIFNEVREELRTAPSNDDWIRWGRWFCADRSTRTIAPFSKTTVHEYIEDRVKENTAESLDEAEMLAVGRSEVLKQIAQAREALPRLPEAKPKAP